MTRYLTTALLLALSTPALAAQRCDWRSPGHDPFMGDVPAAVDRYKGIPPDVRARLKARMARREFTDLVAITRDAMVGTAGAYTNLRQMHFGQGKVCGAVNRSMWTPAMQERALVYCDTGHCVAVPTVCRNVSLIDAPKPGPGAPPLTAPTGPATPTPPEVAHPSLPPGPILEPTGPGSVLGSSPPNPGAVGEPFNGELAPWALGVGALGAGVLAWGATSGGGGSAPSVTAPVEAVTPPVPEPSTLAMLAVGGLFMLSLMRRRK